ncbi:MAG: response regulator [Candidatus Obscuribacterales bacterium]|nr:response regulator [Candidatus Obscuribacterales bacterium]
MARILLVEDDECLAETVEMWLASHGHQVILAFSGTDGLEQMRFGEFDLIILDGRLPDMDGADICREYREDGGKVPVIMVTGNSETAERERGLQAGVNEYIRKPFELNVVLAKMNALLAVSPKPEA